MLDVRFGSVAAPGLIPNSRVKGEHRLANFGQVRRKVPPHAPRQQVDGTEPLSQYSQLCG
jgi:hypothetical protein